MSMVTGALDQRVWPDAFATHRLHMHLLLPEDCAAYEALYRDPLVMRHVGPAMTHDAARRAFARVQAQVAQSPAVAGYWMIHMLEGGPALGLAALVPDAGWRQAELGLLLHAAQQRRSVATEVASGLLDRVFARTCLTSIWTRHAPDHAAALQLMQRLGFVPDGAHAGRTHWRMARARWLSRSGTGTDFALERGAS